MMIHLLMMLQDGIRSSNLMLLLDSDDTENIGLITVIAVVVIFDLKVEQKNKYVISITLGSYDFYLRAFGLVSLRCIFYRL